MTGRMILPALQVVRRRGFPIYPGVLLALASCGGETSTAAGGRGGGAAALDSGSGRGGSSGVDAGAASGSGGSPDVDGGADASRPAKDARVPPSAIGDKCVSADGWQPSGDGGPLAPNSLSPGVKLCDTCLFLDGYWTASCQKDSDCPGGSVCGWDYEDPLHVCRKGCPAEACRAGERCCHGHCRTVLDDSKNCGGCDAVCDPSTPLCLDGKCMSPSCDSPSGTGCAHCCGTQCCTSDQVCYTACGGDQGTCSLGCGKYEALPLTCVTGAHP